MAAVRVDDSKMAKLLEKIAYANKTLIRAGVFEGPPRAPEVHHGKAVDAEHAQPTNAEIGAIHEFGLGVPEHSFIRGTVDKNRSEIQSRLRSMGGSIFSAKSPEEVKHEAQLFGEWFVGEMKSAIREGIPPALSPETIEEKGSSTPLIDSGQLWGSLTYDVEGGRR